MEKKNHVDPNEGGNTVAWKVQICPDGEKVDSFLGGERGG